METASKANLQRAGAGTSPETTAVGEAGGFLAPWRGGLALFLLAVALAIGTAGWGDLYNETDGQYGGAAKTMVHGGSWLVPENNGIPRLVKPPLLYWEMAAAMKIFGVGPFAARLPGAAAIVALAMLTYAIGRRMGGPERGLMAGTIAATCLGMYSLGRIVMPEQTMAALIAGALYCVLRGHDDAAKRRWWFAGFWICASLASFVKGWHGMLYPLAVTGLAALLCRESRPRLRGLISWEGLLIFSLINLPWYFSIEAKYPGWLHNLLFTEQLGHIEGNSSPATDYTSVPRWQFVLLHLAWFFPWSLIAGAALASRWREAWGAMRGVFRRFDATLVVVWAVVIFGSVMLTGQRQDYYAMSMWPAFALAAAWALGRYPIRPGAVVLAVLLGTGFALSFFLGSLASAPETGALAERSTAWTTLTGFDSSVWYALRSTAILALGSGFFCALAAVFLPRFRWVALTGSAVALCLGAVSGMSIVSPYFSLARIAPAIPPGSTVVYDGGIDTGSSLMVYSDAKIVLLDQNSDEEFIVRKFGVGRDRFVTTPELIERWKTAEPLFFVTEGRRMEEWRNAFEGNMVLVARCGTSILLRRPEERR